MKKIIILTGPTGIGKTKYSIQLAKDLNGEIISCDSFQIYRGMDIGTAKVTKEEMDGIIHHNIDIVEPDDDFNVALFQKDTEAIIEDVSNRGKTPILTGGTGLYLHSITHNLDFDGGKSDSKTRKKIKKLVEERGLEYLYDKLITIDPKLDNYLEKNNKHRIMRAYEIYLGKKESPRKYLENFREDGSKYDYIYFIINQDRQDLYDRINKRVDIMVKDGLVEEIKNLLDKGYNFDLRSFKAIGYKEFNGYFTGEKSLEEVLEKIKQHSRNYAKRQLTWFRRVEEGIWLDKDDFKSSEEFYNNLYNLSKEFLNK